MQALEILNRKIIACQQMSAPGGISRPHCGCKTPCLSGLGILGETGAGIWRSERARLLLIGLAPGAHGANRTGRVFTGDSSGVFLYKAMYDTGFASQPTSVSRDDGLTLMDAYISASVRCAPPDNKPLPEEIRNCRPYLERELELLRNVKVVIALGKLAFDGYLTILRDQGKIAEPRGFRFRVTTASIPPVQASLR